MKCIAARNENYSSDLESQRVKQKGLFSLLQQEFCLYFLSVTVKNSRQAATFYQQVLLKFKGVTTLGKSYKYAARDSNFQNVSGEE